MSDTELAVTTSGLPAIPSPDELKEIFDENLGGITPSFPTIKIPTGGMTLWSVMDEAGEETPVKELVGTIIFHHVTRAYWETDMGEGAKQPPTCASLDGKRGSKYGPCADCQFSKFGSEIKNGQQGRGQACGKKVRVFMLLDGSNSIFPSMIALPPTSCPDRGGYPGSFPIYVATLAGKMKPLHGVKTKVKLIKDKNPEGIEYAKAQFFFAGDLAPEEKKNVAALKELLKPAMLQKPIVEEEPVAVDGNGSDKEPWEKEEYDG